MEKNAMGTIRKLALAGAVMIAAGASSLAADAPRSDVGLVTVFDHAKLDASFAKALASGGTAPIWARTSSYGTSDVSVHSRANTTSLCPAQGCSHKAYTAVVIVVSGAATMEVGGTAKAAGADKFGGETIQGGQKRRIAQGDVFIMPPDTMHWYRDVEAPFRYIEVPVP